jgi:hypothetical protein
MPVDGKLLEEAALTLAYAQKLYPFEASAPRVERNAAPAPVLAEPATPAPAQPIPDRKVQVEPAVELVPEVMPEIVNEATRKEVVRILGTVRARALYGKAPKGMSLAPRGSLPGFEVTHGGNNDYGVSPYKSDLERFMPPAGGRYIDTQFSLYLGSVDALKNWPKDYMLFRKVRSKPRSPDEVPQEFTVVTYQFPTRNADGADRTSWGGITAIMPAKEGDKLRDLVADNPDAAEEFVQQLAGDMFEPRTDRDTGIASGVRRKEASSVVVVDSDRFAREAALVPRGDKRSLQTIWDRLLGESAIVEKQYSRTFGEW